MHTAFSVEAVDGVAEADLGSIDALDAEADWSDRAVAIADLGGWLHAHAQARRVVVRGARVLAHKADGPMDFTDLRLDAAVVLRDCRVDAALLLDHALLGRLEVDGCDLRGGVRLKNTKVRGGLRITGGTRIGSVDGISIDGSNATIEGHLEVEGGARLEGGLRLSGATVGGQLSIAGGAQIAVDPSTGWSIDADGLSVAQSLFATGEGTRLEGGVRLVGATVGGQLLICGGAQIAANPSTGWSVAADGLSVASGLFILDECTRLEGGLRLCGASVAGQMSIRGGAQIAADPSTGWSVDAFGLSVTGSLFFSDKDTRLEGGVVLNGASVAGQLTIRGGVQIAADPSTGWSVAADQLTALSLFVLDDDTRLEGGLLLTGASIGGQLVIAGGVQIAADPSTGRSVAADGLGVTSDLFIAGDGTRLEGDLRLNGATVGGQLSILAGARVAKNVNLGAADLAIFTVRSGHVDGVVDLSHARLGRLADCPQGWKQVTGGWRLTGITIEALAGTFHDGSRWTTKQRIDWLQGDRSPSRRPFAQVAGLYLQAGHREQARQVAIAGEKETSSWVRRLLAGATVGYGYQPWRAGIVALVLLVVAWIPVALLGDGIFTPNNADTEVSCPAAYPCLNRPLYLTEAVVPVVDFGQRDAWRIDPDTRYAAVLQTGQYVLDGLGWVLALLLLGAVTGLIHKD